MLIREVLAVEHRALKDILTNLFGKVGGENSAGDKGLRGDIAIIDQANDVFTRR